MGSEKRQYVFAYLCRFHGIFDHIGWFAHSLLTKSDDSVKTPRQRHEDFIFELSRVEIHKFHTFLGLWVNFGRNHTRSSEKKTFYFGAARGAHALLRPAPGPGWLIHLLRKSLLKPDVPWSLDTEYYRSTFGPLLGDF